MYSTYRVAQHDHISSREHAWLKIKDCASLCPCKNYHPRVLSHLPLFASSPICPLGAAAEILAAITSSRNRNKFCVPEDIRQMASEAAKSRDPVRGRHLRKIAQKARREFEAVKAVLPRGKVVGLWSRSSGSMDTPASTETNGRRMSEPIANAVTMTKRKRPEVQAERIRR